MIQEKVPLEDSPSGNNLKVTIAKESSKEDKYPTKPELYPEPKAGVEVRAEAETETEESLAANLEWDVIKGGSVIEGQEKPQQQEKPVGDHQVNQNLCAVGPEDTSSK